MNCMERHKKPSVSSAADCFDWSPILLSIVVFPRLSPSVSSEPQQIPYAAHIADEQTAEIVVAKHPGLKLIADQGLRERQLGSLEGKRWEPKHGIPADAEQSAE